MSEIEQLRSIVDRQEDQLFRYGLTMLRVLAQFERMDERGAWDNANARRSFLAEVKRARVLILRQQGHTIKDIAKRVGRTPRTVEMWLAEVQLPEIADYPKQSSSTDD